MFLSYSLPRSGILAVSERATEIVKWISVGAAAMLFLAILVIAFVGKQRENRGKLGAKRITLAGISLGLSFVLSYVKFSPVASGGSVTIASMVPVLLYAYFYGVADGLLVGAIFGLLNFISGPWILTPMTFVLDYVLAYGSIGLMGFAGKFKKSKTPASIANASKTDENALPESTTTETPAKEQSDILPIILGTLIVYAARFFFHLCSGFIYFAENSIWVEFPQWALANGFIYSFIYQCLYLPLDCLITLIVLFTLTKTDIVKQLRS